MALYETTIVIDSFLKDEDFQNLSAKIQGFIKNNGGQIQRVEEWGKRRLAYEINRKQYGNYLHILFESPSSLPVLLEREYRLLETILRFLTVKTDLKALAAREPKKEKITEPRAEVMTAEPVTHEVAEEAGRL
ncbi:MAG TPA: 30S ribosomal protein S6 [bacterium]